LSVVFVTAATENSGKLSSSGVYEQKRKARAGTRAADNDNSGFALLLMSAV